jgi:hypothetical protein
MFAELKSSITFVSTKTKRQMKTFKLTFKNTSAKIDFVLIDAENEGVAIDIFIANASSESMISIDNVTGQFVDFNS